MTEEKEKRNIKVKIDEEEFEAKYREFKSGKKGYGLYGTVKIDNYPFRISMNLIEF
jgi:hypothetical protein